MSYTCVLCFPLLNSNAVLSKGYYCKYDLKVNLLSHLFSKILNESRAKHVFVSQVQNTHLYLHMHNSLTATSWGPQDNIEFNICEKIILK